MKLYPKNIPETKITEVENRDIVTLIKTLKKDRSVNN